AGFVALYVSRATDRAPGASLPGMSGMSRMSRTRFACPIVAGVFEGVASPAGADSPAVAERLASFALVRCAASPQPALHSNAAEASAPPIRIERIRCTGYRRVLLAYLAANRLTPASDYPAAPRRLPRPSQPPASHRRRCQTTPS